MLYLHQLISEKLCCWGFTSLFYLTLTWRTCWRESTAITSTEAHITDLILRDLERQQTRWEITLVSMDKRLCGSGLQTSKSHNLTSLSHCDVVKFAEFFRLRVVGPDTCQGWAIFYSVSRCVCVMLFSLTFTGLSDSFSFSWADNSSVVCQMVISYLFPSLTFYLPYLTYSCRWPLCAC